MEEVTIKYWLIYSEHEARLAKPFLELQNMENYIKRNDKYITVIAKTEVVE